MRLLVLLVYNDGWQRPFFVNVLLVAWWKVRLGCVEAGVFSIFALPEFVFIAVIGCDVIKESLEIGTSSTSIKFTASP